MDIYVYIYIYVHMYIYIRIYLNICISVSVISPVSRSLLSCIFYAYFVMNMTILYTQAAGQFAA